MFIRLHLEKCLPLAALTEMKQLKNFIARTVAAKFPYEEDISKSNATEHMKKHSPSCVITFHVASKIREVQLLAVEICKCPQVFEWGCKVRTLNWSFRDCDTWVIPLLLSDLILENSGLFNSNQHLTLYKVIFSLISPVVTWNFSFKWKLLSICFIYSP